MRGRTKEERRVHTNTLARARTRRKRLAREAGKRAYRKLKADPVRWARAVARREERDPGIAWRRKVAESNRVLKEIETARAAQEEECRDAEKGSWRRPCSHGKREGCVDCLLDGMDMTHMLSL